MKKTLRWPRAVEADPRIEQVEKLVWENQRPLWSEGKVKVAHLPMNPELAKVFVSLNGLKQLERGLEFIEKILGNEKRGLEALAKKDPDKAPGIRLSRILVVMDGGSERFYRQCEKLLEQHSERVLGVRLVESAPQIIANLFGPDALTKALLLSHKDAVSRFLWSFASESPAKD